MTLPEDDRQVVADLSVISVRLGMNALLIGAGARFYVFDRPYGVLGRLTKDLDFAVQSAKWEDYEQFTLAMTAGKVPLFCRTKIEHRFEHLATNKIVDVIPFGAIALPDQIVNWQDGNQMSVLGLDEAWQSAENIEVAINVVSLPAFIGLKLITWLDRLEAKDLDDVVLILQRLLDSADAIEMVYIALGDLLVTGEVEFEVAGAVYLGQRIRQIFSEQAISRMLLAIERIIQESGHYLPQFVDSYLDDTEWDSAFDLLLERWEALKKGING